MDKKFKNKSTLDPRKGKKDPLADLKAEERRKRKLKEQGSFLTGGQAKLDRNKNNKIDAQDFKILREKAKGRGMGLQDEKMKPGKVKKAVVGMLARGAKKLLGRKRSATATPQDVSMKGKGSAGIGSMLVELFKKKKLGTQGISGPIVLSGAMKRGGVLKARRGRIIKPKGPGVIRPKPQDRYGQPLKPKPITPRIQKKMGGGMMMQKPMAYYGGGMMMRPNPVGMKSGKSVKVKCKLGRNKPTKMY